MTVPSPPLLEVCAALLPLPAESVALLRRSFKTVHYHPDWVLPQAIRGEVDYIFTQWGGLPPDIKIADLPKLKHVQLPTAGVDTALRLSPAIRELKALGETSGITLSTANGIHVTSIPPWVVGMCVALNHRWQHLFHIGREERRWADLDKDIGGAYYSTRNLYGKTAGMLGYGALGRETARLLKAMGMKIIAANTSGKPSSETEYVIPGTGDLDGSIPDKYFSTKDAGQLEEFLRNTDVLVCSLPNTAATQYMLNAEHLGMLKKDGLFINIGRGTLIQSDEILKALDSDHLFGAALDVTDPEPLPDNHPLWTHPRCIITPHASGNTTGEYELGAEVAVANAQRIREGKRPFNLVDLDKGY